ncbi:MAG: hypothetical protein IJ390_05625 [Lachnospiraceae bacterium]|nr:hypothetical protein [Lachnospiraceae bacterium]
MSFIDEIKNELQREKTEENAATHPLLQDERFQTFIQEELTFLQNEIRQAARTGNYKRIGEKHVFEGTRLWHEGDYRQGTDSLATFYPFLARDTILEKKILEQRKKLILGFYYEVSFSLTAEGSTYYQLFADALAKEGITVSMLFVMEDNGKAADLPYIARGDAKYDFELEHHLNDYPKLYYKWKMEI